MQSKHNNPLIFAPIYSIIIISKYPRQVPFYMNIQEIKNEISLINDEMLKLFIRHLELTVEAGRLREADGKPLYDRKAEEITLETAAANSPQNMQNYSIEFFRSLINLSKDYYKDNK